MKRNSIMGIFAAAAIGVSQFALTIAICFVFALGLLVSPFYLIYRLFWPEEEKESPE